MILTGTGSRKFHLDRKFADNVDILQKYMQSLEYPVHVLLGGAQGFDYMLALACKAVEVEYTVCLPNRTYIDYYWRGKGNLDAPRPDMLYYPMLENAKEVVFVDKELGIKGLYDNGLHINMIRNKYMVDRADRVVTMDLGEPSSGTDHCIRYANRMKVPVDHLQKS